MDVAEVTSELKDFGRLQTDEAEQHAQCARLGGLLRPEIGPLHVLDDMRQVDLGVEIAVVRVIDKDRHPGEDEVAHGVDLARIGREDTRHAFPEALAQRLQFVCEVRGNLRRLGRLFARRPGTVVGHQRADAVAQPDQVVCRQRFRPGQLVLHRLERGSGLGQEICARVGEREQPRERLLHLGPDFGAIVGLARPVQWEADQIAAVVATADRRRFQRRPSEYVRVRRSLPPQRPFRIRR